MKRREFITYTTASLIMSGCQIQYSPYAVDTDEPKRDEADIKRIPPKSLSGKYSIALISDTHRYYEELKSVIENINDQSTPYNFVIHSGDITEAGLQSEFNFYHKMRSRLSIPFVHCIGNHDALSNGPFVFRNSYGDYDYKFQSGTLHVIVFNNNTWEFGDKPVDLDWLEDKLEKAKNIVDTQGGHILVVNHINHDSDERFSAVEIERYRSLMKIYGVSLSINGHNHGHTVQEIEGMKYLTVGSVGNLAYVRLTFNGPAREDFILENINV